MKYLAVVEFQDQCYQLHDVQVVSGIKEAEALRNEIEEFDDNHAYSVSFLLLKIQKVLLKNMNIPHCILKKKFHLMKVVS